ncbi:maleylpyruvate isomerase family mycothiol-dependent enzyme [Streptomyces sp. NPDC052036]|uniref:maleylpyruvate isomerase family mycothiol-dependent enzyme n=1 Tax=Streptomyces sp. NPDC052036 TaxID=3155171 RepID=UPI00342668E5
MTQAVTPATTAPDSWLSALHGSSEHLAAVVEGLSEEALARPSFAQGWSVAQVLSHLGSAAEICTALVLRGLADDLTPPRQEDNVPVWERWNAMAGPELRAAWREADSRHLSLLDALDDSARSSLRVPYFSGPLSVLEYVGYRLSEQSVHAWDVDIALNPAAVIPAAEVDLLWDRLDLVATRFRDAHTLSRLAPGSIAVRLTDRPRTLCLLLGTELHIYPCEAAEPTGTLSGSAEAVLRLVYGRNRPEEDGVTATGAATLPDLRSLFPGY